MNQKTVEIPADSVIDAQAKALLWMKQYAPSDVCWFRGITDASHGLLPGAYWRPKYDEVDVLLRFSQQGLAYDDVGGVDDWKTYYFAQHNGIPTRLLDWTENFITALFFATDWWDGKTTPCVWIVRPCTINLLSFNWAGVISPERNPELSAWLPSRVARGSEKIPTADRKWVYDSAHPIALFPRKDNPRLVAQQGTFTVHGATRTPLEQWIAERDPQTYHSVICKIVFSKKMKRDQVRSDLDDLGLRRSTIYPDLANFVQELKDRVGW